MHDGQPYVIPTLSARVDDVVYLHEGRPAGRSANRRGSVSVGVTLGGIVLARSIFEYSVNYRRS